MSKVIPNEIQELIDLFRTGQAQDAQKAAIMAEQLGLIEQFESCLAELKQFFAQRWRFMANIDSSPIRLKLARKIVEARQSKSLGLRMLLDSKYAELKELKALGGLESVARWQRFNASFKERWVEIFKVESIHQRFMILPFPKHINLLPALQVVVLKGRLKKEIIQSLLRLTQIKELKLSSCELAQLPDNIGTLRSLEVLDISSNKLKELPASTIELLRLKELNLNYNKLEQLPEKISSLQNLRKLEAVENQLKEFPPIFSQLEHLNLNKNRLTTIPQSIGKLSNLLTLECEHNQLAAIPASLGNLKKLEHLSLSYNRIMHIPKELGQLSNLKRLYLYSNGIDLNPKGFFKKMYYFITGNNKLYIDDLPKELLALEQKYCKISM